METKQSIGKTGEKYACEYLVEKGFKIVDKNFRMPYGEIDIISMAPDKTLVFVEVKTTTASSYVKPEDQMTSAKLEKFYRIAQLYANNHPELVRNKRGFRLDVLAIEKNGGEYAVRHYENI